MRQGLVLGRRQGAHYTPSGPEGARRPLGSRGLYFEHWMEVSDGAIP